MSDIIQLLPDHVANQIAAGEVVQRPASVVKELLENAIDAKATTIKLLVKDAGKTLVQVIDNGSGMSVTDSRLSFERHATSKIRSAEDLFQLHTKGFRGEALASIAAIAHVELKTKQAHDEVGTQLIVEGSEVVSQEVVVTPKGTSIAVKNLFFNIPARRNFLKSNQVETRHIIDEFHRVALAHPNIQFVMYHNGSEVFNLPESNYRQRIVNIFGAKTNEKLVPVNEETEVVKISGFVGKPEYAKKTRGEQFFFVNDRFIKSAYLNHAISSAFEGLLKDSTHPSYFLNLTVDPQTIDINIHPTKTEIKFDDEHTLYAILRASVKHSLGQFNIAPVLDFDRDANLDTPYEYKDKHHPNVPNIEVDRSFNPFQEKQVSGKQTTFLKKQTLANWDSLYVGLESKGTQTQQDFTSVQFESEEQTGSIFKDSNQVETKQTTFQIQNKYIISTIKSGMLVIDQYRAHQRVLYEDFLQHITVKESMSQQLLFPVQLHFSPQEIEILRQVKEDLEHTGFLFSNFTNDGIEISGVPVHVPESEVSVILEQLISDIENEVPDSNFSPTDLLAKSMAKSLAVKSGQSLSVTEQEHLVNSLFGCKEPNMSPTNKSTFVTLSVDELDKKFI
ncbi:MAG: DNA mismatch repair protein MutL [Xanthomarina sp.]|uniref:DNA mismatch repair endonuclease MutL n=1 Tax=Xanthomarina sp. TaxID=1931211 RepID=UPI000C53D86A|nr:DNA mismatch repair endonuclease MutL [Xanthomarina sp.]MBF61656.1 DNA mismatch repair protein MutL [Xanthomarina sp.]HAB28790.1 DNA mismatch repair endonuclease MutL [Xanthomarina gelatinilytica]HAI16567.1 DNA mismatch repair endonuclease MutL [Xanthomarina gelatinilytica]|tara:strand:- start:60 stop:1913 length:1854 start_codon:yes stop_codon:yes gene_type:complete